VATEQEDLLVGLATTRDTLYFGKYSGVVREVDPESMCVRAEVPAVYHDAITPWAMPCVPFAGPKHGLVLLPEVGDGVWIEFEAGRLEAPIWSGCFWANDQRPTPSTEKARLLSTSAGHQILLDEDADEIGVVHPGGAQITISKDEIKLSLGGCVLKVTRTEIDLNNGMVKVTTAGASLVNDALKLGG
jgi:hypothetical protein